MMRIVILMSLLAGLLPGVAQAQSVAICQANLPQFPQACPCIIERSQAQGIDGPVLDALLANQVANLPIGTFQSYGAIFTQCITDVVTGSAPAGVEAPQPAATVTVMQSIEPRAPGTWGLTALEFLGGGVAMPGTFDGQGGAVALHCSGGPHAASLVLEGIDAGPSAPVMLQVTGGNGRLFERQVTSQRYAQTRSGAGPIWQTPLTPDLVEALRRGSSLIVTPQTGRVREFGLSGSNRAIGPGTCAIPAADRGFPLAGFDRVPEGRWVQDTMVLSAGLEPVLRYSVGVPFLPELLVTCDGALATRQRPGRGFSGDFAAELALYDLEGVIIADFALDGNAYRTAPLDPAALQSTAAAPEWLVAFDIYAEPGDVVMASFGTEGLAEGLAGLACPAPFEPGPPPQALAGAWSFGEIPDLPRPDLFAAATFLPEDRDVPPLNFECSGVPFIDQSLLGALLPRASGYRLRISVGDLVFEDSFGGMRLWGRPSELPAEFLAALQSAPDIRVTGLDAPGYDAVYPLTGLDAFFSGPLCPP